MNIGDAPQRVRAFVCNLSREDLVEGPLWKIYETQKYDLATDSVNIYGVTFKVEDPLQEHST